MHQVRSDLVHQQAPLVERLPHQFDIQILQVSQPAVDQLAGAARGAGRPVPFLDQGHGEPATGCVEGDAAPGDAAAEHQHIKDLGAQTSQSRPALLRTERRCRGTTH